jgi:hypothetical protein
LFCHDEEEKEMRAKLLSVAAVLIALAAAPPALADSGTGALVAGLQQAATAQAAAALATSQQHAVNANVPVSIAGGGVNAGPSSAAQTASSSANTNATNNATTNQGQSQQQTAGGSSSCRAGCGGAGAAQVGGQTAETHQGAVGVANSNQHAVNANVPVSIAGGNVNSGPSSAAQTASSAANTNARNNATTNQGQSQQQTVGGSNSCVAGCGGAGAAQVGGQTAETHQGAIGVANSNQTAVNANVPVSIAGGDVNSGPSSAAQTASSSANTNARNNATTNQGQSQQQTVGGNSSCLAGCGGAGGLQLGAQEASTHQGALGVANSDQTAVNANVPVSIAGGDVNSGPSSAAQTASSGATANVGNNATTNQGQSQSQSIGGNDSCLAGCGGAGGAQLGIQNAETHQGAIGVANSDQTAVNANVPVSIAGGDVNSGPSSAAQTASSDATANVRNNATTNQGQSQQQMVGGNGSCLAGCGGAGGLQVGVQNAETRQLALGLADSDQTAVNGNAPVSIAGGDVNSGPSSAAQTASSNATANVRNNATTNQGQSQSQSVGGNDSCLAGCGGAGGAQLGVQNAETTQIAIGLAHSGQTAVNTNAPVSIAGGDVNSGPSSAAQTAGSGATANVTNNATTNQGQSQEQTVGGNGSCLAGCGGPGAAQIGIQNAETAQFALGLAGSEQTAVNANAPVSIAGGDINSGPSSAAQTANSSAGMTARNNATTNQGQSQQQSQQLSLLEASAPGRHFEATTSSGPPRQASVPRTTMTTRQVTSVAGERVTKTTSVQRTTGLAGVRTSRTLPFTGVSLLEASLLGLLLILGGVGIRRFGRPALPSPT